MDKQSIIRQLENTGLKAAAAGADKFAVLLRELTEWNARFNLTSIDDPQVMLIKHIIDSLELITTNICMPNITIIDIGTGAGFPGIPLAIALPGCRFYLNESNAKKLMFLKHVVNMLALNNVTVLPGRAEELARDKNHREKYDVCVMRALAPLPVALELCAGLVRDRGYAGFYASSKQVSEASASEHAIKELGFTKAGIFSYELPQGMGSHAIISVKKVWKTPEKYPRSYAAIKKKPL